MSGLHLQDLQWRRGQQLLLSGIRCQLQPGEWLAIIGPNGAGKSSLLSLLAGNLSAQKVLADRAAILSGAASWQGQNLLDHRHQHALARCRAWLTQATTMAFPLSVRETVALGRYPHAEAQVITDAVVKDVADALELMPLLTRNVLSLSGGEQARVQIARVLAQVWCFTEDQAPLLLLDEPFAALDLRYQALLQQVLRQRFLHHGACVVMVAHHLEQVAQATRVMALKAGAMLAEGPCSDIVQPALLGQLFDMPPHFRFFSAGRI